MIAPRRVLATAVTLGALTLSGCRHVDGPGVFTGNDIMVDQYGLPTAPAGQLHRCPSSNGEGNIQLTYDNGKKRVKGTCKAGVMVGDWTGWYNNGAVAWKATLDDGRIVGHFLSYYADDSKRADTEFKAGLAQGNFTSWWKNGKKRYQGEYVGGKKNGCWESWHENGEKAFKGTYADDRQVLTWLSWTPTGDKSKQTLGGEAKHGQCLITF